MMEKENFVNQGVGKVFLVGAGPGDPDLLTLKAVKVLQQADVVLIDDLVSPAVLEHVPAQARQIHVGKRGGCKSTPQAFIERLMIEEARAGHCVVRLKGGDPFMFGRGGEERETLAAAGIAVEIINGITSGIAAPTAFDIPLTHRDFSQGAIFVTGHGKDAESQPNWTALVATHMTLVIYMGVARAAEIQAALLAAGMSAQMPVAIIQSASLATQRGVLTNLQSLTETITTASLASPSILVIGEVARCGAAVLEDWLGQSGSIGLGVPDAKTQLDSVQRRLA